MMPAIVDAILVAAALILAIAYLVYYFIRKRRTGACCESCPGKEEEDRIQIELPKDR